MRMPMSAAIDRPQALNMTLRNRRLTPLKGAAGYLPISQSAYRTTVAKIKAGIRIETRSDFITANSTAAPATTASGRDTYSQNEKHSGIRQRYCAAQREIVFCSARILNWDYHPGRKQGNRRSIRQIITTTTRGGI